MSADFRSLLKEFRPAVRFLTLFATVYVVGNVLYGIWIEHWKPEPDPMTRAATAQTIYILRALSEPVSFEGSTTEPLVFLFHLDHVALRIFEGCNGINVMIVFTAFLVAFDGQLKKKLIFIMSGLVLLHLSNLLRITLLYFTAIYRPTYFYYFHKYLFTAVLYFVVFVMWYGWIQWIVKKEDFVAAKK